MNGAVPKVIRDALLSAAVGIAVQGCASPPQEARTESVAASGVARLAAPFRDYAIGTRRPGAGNCIESGSTSIRLQYVESLEYVDAPSVMFGLEGDCIREIRTDYVLRGGHFEHAIAFVSQRLGPPDGEDRATCTSTGEEMQAVYWDQSEGRFLVVRAGYGGQPEFVLRPAGTPESYGRHCDGPIVR